MAAEQQWVSGALLAIMAWTLGLLYSYVGFFCDEENGCIAC